MLCKYCCVQNLLDAQGPCSLCFSLETVKRPNEFGDGRLFSGRDQLGGGKALWHLSIRRADSEFTGRPTEHPQRRALFTANSPEVKGWVHLKNEASVMICVTQCWWKVKQSFVALLVHHKTNFSRLLFHSPRSFTVPRVEHRVSIFRASRDARLGEGQLVALHPGPHPGHHHRHELPGRPSRGGLRRPPPVLHLLLQRPVIALLHHPGELQLRTVRRPQAQGQTEPTALLHRGVRGEETLKKKKKGDGRDTATLRKKNLSLLSSFPPVHFSVSLRPRRCSSPDNADDKNATFELYWELFLLGRRGTVPCW